MPSPGQERYCKFVLEWCRKHADDPDVGPQLERYGAAALVLWHLDLEPARAVLQPCYAPNPRGGRPWDPVVMLRCFLLAALVGQPSLNDWADDLAGSRILRVLAGIDPEDEERPGVGTLYDFLGRLHDGPVRKTCPHAERPSERERRRARTPRRLSRKEKALDAKKRKQESRRRKRRRQPDGTRLAGEAVEQAASATERVVAELAATKERANPNDLLERLGQILLEVGVIESARRGLLGDVSHLAVGGDGSPLHTGANRHGRRACEHPRSERCDCPRHYSDPDAEWGYDSHRDEWFFGYHFYEISTSVGGHDLPLALHLDPANSTDFTLSLLTLDRLTKRVQERLEAWQAEYFIADAGHDAEPIHRFLVEQGTTPIIPLKTAARATHPTRPEVHLSPRGVPTCQAGCEMAHWGSAGQGRVAFICPIRAHKLERCPLAPECQPDWHCRPDQKWGPTVTIKTRDNPRLCPPLPRNSARFQQLYNLRSGCERSNSVKKEIFQLEAARHRRASFWLTRLHLIAVLQHARAWVADEDARAHVDFLLGRQPTAGQEPTGRKAA